ncbi:SusD-like starch-binding protein associating with outer membrane [Flavobacterium sp. 90]|uniref:RagB/SusD family nutrient uptake outer membrane protein n=1 Tax=unclassified Flavobacterium TaxID=196869 RepID=UPI000EAC616A|nr:MULTISPECIES: RagB/SusD family nutrient uptake outer membrane protein [unclassified Flavobacterium]RKR09006.1 SusD-like starch-binding protein associating with outer membrane [Flavobacterium sp. 81]TCK52793.1 SusD-like starch-binding protein associating with outer membrane [Flavobacterium sp. 90]
MKNIYKNILCVLALGLVLASCSNYLDDAPKGSKIPTTLADFEAFLRDEYTNQSVDIAQASTLINDKFIDIATLAAQRLTKANYMWDETADRIQLNQSDERQYYGQYAGISTFNLIIANALTTTEATEDQKRAVWAEAKILRAMSYYNLVNFYADTYVASTAGTKLSVPLITSADINAPSKQVTIQELYDFILADVKDALPYLPKVSQTALHPNLGAGYAFYSRVYLQMNNYTEALKYANLALTENNKLYDWVAYYNANKAVIDIPNSYTNTPSPMGFDYVENYTFRHGERTYLSTEYSIPVERAQRFEAGDVRFKSRWKLRTVGADTYYRRTLSGMFNYGGITTVEVYLIKAECLARAGQISDALDVLNTVRKTRILPASYQDITTSDKTVALNAIFKTKYNELILTIIPFADARRLNAEGLYKLNLSKTAGGVNYALATDSHLWTMPFPQGATKNPGNGTLTQNVGK